MSKATGKSRGLPPYSHPEEVRAGLRSAIQETGGRGLRAGVLRVLKRRITFDISSELVAGLVGILSDPRAQDSMHFAIAAEGLLAKRPSVLLSRVASELVRSFRQRTGFLDIAAAAGPEGLTRERVLEWVHTALREDAERKEGSKHLLAARARLVLGALLPDSTREFFVDAVLCVMRASVGHVIKGLPRGSEEAEAMRDRFRRAGVSLFKPSQPSLRTLKVVLDLVELFASRLTRAIEDLRVTHQLLQSSRDEVATLRSELSALKEQAALLNESQAALVLQLEESRNQTKEERLRYEALDQHWAEVSKAERAKLVFDLKHKLDHEITEILLSLERDRPNLGMALDRVRNIQQILTSMVKA